MLRFWAAAAALGGILGAVSCSLDPRVGPPLEDGGSVDSGAAAGDAESGAPEAATPDGQAGISFAAQIRPLINRAQNDASGGGCRDCHDSTQPRHTGLDMSGFDTATLKSIRRGGNAFGARVIVAGNPTGSAIVEKLEGRQTNGVRMPKGETPWSTADIALVRQWIAEGAVGGDAE
jgi:hypothetical protein